MKINKFHKCTFSKIFRNKIFFSNSTKQIEKFQSSESRTNGSRLSLYHTYVNGQLSTCTISEQKKSDQRYSVYMPSGVIHHFQYQSRSRGSPGQRRFTIRWQLSAEEIFDGCTVTPKPNMLSQKVVFKKSAPRSNKKETF